MAEMTKSFPAPGTGPEAPPGEPSSRQITPDVKEVASNVAEQAKQVASGTMSRQAERSAADISQVARALRQTKEQLGGNFAEPYVDRTADQIERLARFVRTADAGQMLRGVESFARREPLVFLGGAFALGMLGARFLKSSGRGARSEPERERARPYPLSGYERPRIAAPAAMPESKREYGSRADVGSPYTPATGPRGVVEERTGPTSARAGASGPDPRGDYPPNEPGQGPFPGGGAGGRGPRPGRGRPS